MQANVLYGATFFFAQPVAECSGRDIPGVLHFFLGSTKPKVMIFIPFLPRLRKHWLMLCVVDIWFYDILLWLGLCCRRIAYAIAKTNSGLVRNRWLANCRCAGMRPRTRLPLDTRIIIYKSFWLLCSDSLSPVGYPTPRLCFPTLIWLIVTETGVGTHLQIYGAVNIDSSNEILSPDALSRILLIDKYFFAEEILLAGGLLITKFSILAFYWRIFNRSSMRMAIYILSALVSSLGLSAVSPGQWIFVLVHKECWYWHEILATTFQCYPVEAQWSHVPGAKCNVKEGPFFVAISIANTLTDMALLALPIPYVYRLQIHKKKRLALSANFLCGGMWVDSARGSPAHLKTLVLIVASFIQCLYHLDNQDYLTCQFYPSWFWRSLGRYRVSTLGHGWK